MLGPRPESFCTRGVGSETTNWLVDLFWLLSVNGPLPRAESTYVLLLHFPIDCEVKGFLDIIFVFGAAQRTERNVTLVAVTSILVGIVYDLPL